MSADAMPTGLPRPLLPDSAGAALCRRFCRRLKEAGAGDPIRHRPVSADGLALCARFCRSFAAMRPVTVSRPRRRHATPEIAP